MLALQDKRIPKIHYIDELAHMLELPEEIITRIIGLTTDYTFARYPDVSEEVPFEQYDERIAREKVESAKKVFELLRERYGPLIENESRE